MAPRRTKDAPRDAIQTRSRTIQKRKHEIEGRDREPQRRLTGTNFLIVKALSRYMDTKSLQQNRLVHPLWSQICQKTLLSRNDPLIPFKTFKRLDTFSDLFESSSSSSMIGRIIPRRFLCQRSIKNMTSLVPRSKAIVDKFLDLYGNSISYLDLNVRFKFHGEMSRFQHILSKLKSLVEMHIIVEEDGDGTLMLFPEQFPVLSKMKKFYITFLEPIQSVDPNQYQDYGRMLIESFPNLETLRIDWTVDFNHNRSKIIFKTLAEDWNRFKNLQRLSIAVDDSTLNILGDAQFRLKAISFILKGELDNTWTTSTSRSLESFLRKQSSTLESIFLGLLFHRLEIIQLLNNGDPDRQIGVTAPLKFPLTMPKLLQLRIFCYGRPSWNGSTRNEYIPLVPINYKLQFPNIRTIIFQGNDIFSQTELISPLFLQSSGLDNVRSISSDMTIKRTLNNLQFETFKSEIYNFQQETKHRFPNAKKFYSKMRKGKDSKVNINFSI